MNLARRLSQLIKLTLFSLVVIIPFVFTSTTTELFEFPKIQLVYALTIIILTAWACLVILHRRFIFRRTPLDIPLIIFLAAMSLSTLLSVNPHTSIWGYYSRFNGGLASLTAYIIIYWATVTHLTIKDIYRLLRLSLASAVIISLWAILESTGHSLSCLIIRNQFDVSCWIQDVAGRPYATLGQPNWLAAYLTSLVFIPLALILTKLAHIYPNKLSKTNLTALIFTHLKSVNLITVTAYLIILSAIFLTKSRSALLAFGLGLPSFLGLIYLTSRSHLQLIRPKTHLIAFALISLTVALFIGTPWTPKLTSLITPPPTNLKPVTTPAVLISESGDIRKIVWRGAITAWLTSPKTILVGFGPESFAYAYYLYRPLAHNQLSEWDYLYNKAHNELLNYLTTTGLLGLTTYLLIPLVLGFYLFTKSKHSTSSANPNLTQTPILIALLIGLGTIYITNFFGFSTVVVNLYYFIFLGLVIRLCQPDPTILLSPTIPVKLNRTQILSLIIVLLAGLNGLVIIHHQYRADQLLVRAKTYDKAGQSDLALHFIQKSLRLRPNEPILTDQYATALARLAAISFATDSTTSAKLAQAAIDQSNKTLLANPTQLNFYKNRAKLMLTLASTNPAYYQAAIEALTAAQLLAPTDPKLPYNLGIIYKQLKQNNQAIDQFNQAIALKPNYFKPHWQLYRTLLQQGKLNQAKTYLSRIAPDFPLQQPDIRTALEKLADH